MDIAPILIALAALFTAFLAYRQQIINLTVIREERYFKEMDLLVKKLYQNRNKYEKFEPNHVDPNNPEEEKQAAEFWRQVRENKYLAPEGQRNTIDQYLKIVDGHEQNILENRTTLSDILSKRCKKLETFKENLPEGRALGPVDTCIKNHLCPMLGERGLVKPIPY